MELNWLETFIVLSESSSMRNAAATLGISPATASERIAFLEAELGTKLLERTSKGSELTTAGKVYIKHAKKLIQSWDNICSLITPSESDSYLRLRLGFPTGIMLPSVGRFLDEFIKKHSQIEFSILSDAQKDASQMLRSNDVDLFFIIDPDHETLKGMVSDKFSSCRFGVVVPSSHRLAMQESAALKDFNGETFILQPNFSSSKLRQTQLSFLNNSGIHYFEYGGAFSQSHYRLAVKMGCGVALCPDLLKKNIPPHTTYIELTDPDCSCDIYSIHSPENNNPALKLFLDELKELKGAIRK